MQTTEMAAINTTKKLLARVAYPTKVAPTNLCFMQIAEEREVLPRSQPRKVTEVAEVFGQKGFYTPTFYGQERHARKMRKEYEKLPVLNVPAVEYWAKPKKVVPSAQVPFFTAVGTVDEVRKETIDEADTEARQVFEWRNGYTKDPLTWCEGMKKLEKVAKVRWNGCSASSDEGQAFDRKFEYGHREYFRFPRHNVRYAVHGAALNRVVPSPVDFLLEKVRVVRDWFERARRRRFVVHRVAPRVCLKRPTLVGQDHSIIDSDMSDRQMFESEEMEWMQDLVDAAEDQSFCCSQKCMKVPSTQVDGRACKKCKSFGYCKCKCKTFMSKKIEEPPAKFCCPLKCKKVVTSYIVIPCRKCVNQWFCACDCITYQNRVAHAKAEEQLEKMQHLENVQFRNCIARITATYHQRCTAQLSSRRFFADLDRLTLQFSEMSEKQMDSETVKVTVKNFVEALKERATTSVASDFWNDFVFRNRSTFVLWTLLMMTIFFFVSTSIGTLMMTVTSGVAAWRSGTNYVRVAASEVVAPVIDRAASLVEKIEDVVAQAPQTAQKAVDSVVDGLTSISSVCSEQGVSIKNLCASINQHKIGIGANIALLASAKDINQLIYILVSTFSMVGLEQSIINSFIARLTSMAVPDGSTRQMNDGIGIAMSDFWARHKLTWDVKRLSGIAGLLTSVFGISLLGKDILQPLSKANANAESIEKIWDKIEEYLNSLGFLNTGKWAYMKEIETLAKELIDDFEWINVQMATSPSYFCKTEGYNKWLNFRAKMRQLDDICRKNTCPDLKSNKLFVSVQTMMVKVTVWDAEISRVRNTNGKRVEPVGICIVGKSQLGKSKLRSEIVRRVTMALERMAKEQPAFHRASRWQTWNVQARDEYDQGYAGQEITYMDDGFADKEDKDHQMWLSFISGEAIGTVQAQLQEKGLPYASRMCIVSCNNLPRKSTAINNVSALHNRFPYTIGCRLKPGKQLKSTDEAYDPNFDHLEFHFSSMSSHCLMGLSQCAYMNGGAQGICQCENLTLDEIVSRIVMGLVTRQQKFDSEMDSFYGIDNSYQAELASQITPVTGCDGDMTKQDRYDLQTQDLRQLRVSIASERQMDPGFAYPEFTTVSPSDTWRLKKLVCEAYRYPLLTELLDYEVYDWAQYLYHPLTNECFEDLCVSFQIHNLFELLSLLPALRVREEHLDEFKRAWLTTFVKPRRVRDERLETDYLYGYQFDFGMRLYAIPTVDGVIDSFDQSVEQHAEILRYVSNTRAEMMVVPNTDYAIVNFLAPTPISNVSTAWLAVSLYAAMPFNPSGFIALLADCLRGVDKWVRRRQYRTPTSETAMGRFYRTPLAKVKDLLTPAWNGVVKMNNVLKDCLGFVTNVAKSISNFFTYIFYTIAEWLGLDFGNVVQQLAAIVIDKVAMATIGLVSAMIVGFVWGIFSFFSRSTASEDQYERKEVKRTILKQLKPGSNVFKQAQERVEQLVRQRAPEDHKVNYYEEDISCPFCDEEVYTADGPVKEIDEFRVKPNRFPMWKYHNVVFSKDHKLDDPLQDGSFVDELCATFDDAESEGHEWFGVEKCYGPLAGGSVPHNHMKWYNQLKDECPFEIDNQYIQACAEKFGCAYDICTKSGDSNRRIIELTIATPTGYDHLYDTLHMFDTLFEMANAKSWYMAGFVKEGWLYATITLLEPVNAPGMYGWTKNEITQMREEIKVICGYVYTSSDLFARDPTVAFDTFSRHMRTEADTIVHQFPAHFKHSHVCRWCSRTYIHYHNFTHPAHGQYEKQCPYEDCEQYHGGENPTGSEKRTTYNESSNSFKFRSQYDRKMSHRRRVKLSREYEVKPVVQKRKVISRPESCDDASLDLMAALNDTVSVYVQRFSTSGFPTDWTRIDVENSGSEFGIAYGRYVFVPCHIAPLGGLVKVRSASGYRVREDILTRPYSLAQMIHVDEKKELGVLKLHSVKEARGLIESLGGDASCMHQGNGQFVYSTMIDSHLMTWEEWSAVVSRRVGVAQWLPTKRMIQTGTAEYKGEIAIHMSDTQRPEIHDVVAVYGIQSSINATSKGDCGGIVLAMNSKLPRKIIGMHCYGSSQSAHSTILYKELVQDLVGRYESSDREMRTIVDAHPVFDSTRAGHGHLQLSGWPEVKWSDFDPWNLERQGTPADLPHGQDVQYVALSKIYPVNTQLIMVNSQMKKRSSEWVQSPFWGAFPVRMEPSALSPHDHRIEVDLPVNALNQPSLFMKPDSVMGRVLPPPDLEVLDKVYDQVLENWLEIFAEDDMSVPENLVEAVHQGLNGINTNTFVGGMEVKASCGTPWNVAPQLKKHDMINVDARGERTFKDNPEGRHLENLCYFKLAEMKEGRRVKSYCLSKLKNTLIKSEQVQIGKTRVYNASAIEDVVIGNTLFGQFKEAFMKHSKQLSHAIGINVHSLEWKILYQELNQHPNWLDVDYSNYDKHLPSVFMRLAYKLIIEIIARTSPDCWDVARYVAAETFINSLMVDRATIYMTEHSNKSGDVLTTIINSIVNFLFMFYSYSVAIGMVNYSHFRENVCFRTMGDDIVMTVSNDVADQFNFVILQQILTSIGQEATCAAKTVGEVPKFTPKELITFLKRRFQVVGTEVLAPLPDRVVESTFNWTQISPNEHTVWVENLDNHLFEAVLLGEEYYEYFTTQLKRVMRLRPFSAALKALAYSKVTVPFEVKFRQYLDILYGYSSRQMDEAKLPKTKVPRRVYAVVNIGSLVRAAPLYVEEESAGSISVKDQIKQHKGLYEWLSLIQAGGGDPGSGDRCTALAVTTGFSWRFVSGGGTATNPYVYSITYTMTPLIDLSLVPYILQYSLTIRSGSTFENGDTICHVSESNPYFVPGSQQQDVINGSFNFATNTGSAGVTTTPGLVNLAATHADATGVINTITFSSVTYAYTPATSTASMTLAFASRSTMEAAHPNGTGSVDCANVSGRYSVFLPTLAGNSCGSRCPAPTTTVWTTNSTVTSPGVIWVEADYVPSSERQMEEDTYDSDNTYVIEVKGNPTYMPKIPGLMSVAQVNEQVKDGGVLSEVGPATDICWIQGRIPGFVLRPHQPGPTLYHKYGYCRLGNAWAVPTYTSAQLAATQTLQPSVSQAQYNIMTEYAGFRCKVVYVLRLDEPLGGSHLIEIRPAFADSASSKRGIRWKPKEMPTVAVEIGWEWNRPYITNATTAADIANAHLPIFPGFSLLVNLLEDNSTSTLATPVQFMYWNTVLEVECFGYLGAANSATGATIQWSLLNSDVIVNPATASAVVFSERQMDDAAPVVEGEGGVQATLIPPTPLPSVYVPEEPAVKPVQPNVEVGQVQDPATKWYPWFQVSLDASSVNTPVTQTIIPAAFPGAGESLGLPFRRNVYVTGSWDRGFCKALEVKIISNRAPMFAGLLEVSCGQLAAWNGCRLAVGFHELGKGETTHFLVFDQHFVDFTSREGRRALVSPWILTSVASCSLTLNCISLNKTQDIESIDVQVYIRPCGAKFSHPQRPLPIPSTTVQSMVKAMKTVNELDMNQLIALAHALSVTDVEEKVVYSERQMEVVPANATKGTAFGYTDGLQHHVIQDDFWLKVGSIGISVTTSSGTGSVSASQSLDLFNATDLFVSTAGSTWNTLTEKFQRFHYVVPFDQTGFGAVFGKYKLVARLPTNISANIEHVCLSSDMAVQSASIVAGTSTPMSYGGAKVVSFGAIQNSGLYGGGGRVQVNSSKGAGDVEDNLGDDMGFMPASRFSTKYNTFRQDAGANAVGAAWPTLCIRVTDVVANPTPTTAAPINFSIVVLVNCKGLKFEWGIWDRVSALPAPITVLFSPQEIGSFMLYAVNSGNATLALKAAARTVRNKFRSVTLEALEDEPDVTAQELQGLIDYINSNDLEARVQRRIL